MGPPSYMRSVVDRNVVMRRMTVYRERAKAGNLIEKSRNNVYEITYGQLWHDTDSNFTLNYFPYALCWEVAYVVAGVWLVFTKSAALQLVKLIFSCL